MGKPGVGPAEVIAQLQELIESLPERTPATLRVGVGVIEVLRAATSERPAGIQPGHLFGVPVVPDDAYALGEWRLVDHHGAEMQAGQIEAFRGLAPDVDVIRSRWLPPGLVALRFDDLNALVFRDDSPAQPPEEETAP